MIEQFVGRGRPVDERGFVHKRLAKFAFGVAKRAIPALGVAETVISTGRSFLGGGRNVAGRTATARQDRFSRGEKERVKEAKFRGDLFFPPQNGAAGPCADPDLIRNPQGQCVAPGSPFGIRTLTGEPVLGIYGAGIRPGSMIIDRAVCGKKMQLGDDGICYNKSQISNKQRMWPAGRKPLLTGGDMRAISVASRAGKRLEGTTKRLQRLGLMKKPSSTRRGPTQHQRLLEAHATK